MPESPVSVLSRIGVDAAAPFNASIREVAVKERTASQRLQPRFGVVEGME